MANTSAIPTRTPAAPAESAPAASKSSKAAANTSAAKSKLETKVSDLTVENRMKSLEKKKKSDKNKVIRDSFSFPEHDYHKISELKKVCLASGVHVKKGEILRAGLNLLTQLKLGELIKAVEAVERVKTGRPKSHKD